VIAIGLLATAAWIVPVAAQSLPASPSRETPDAYPPALPPREGPPQPKLIFRQVDEISLPGPLRDEPLRLDDGTARVAVNGGWAIVTLGDEPSVQISTTAPAEPASGDEDAPEWVTSADGRFRFRTDPSGKVFAERKRRKGWRKAWKRRIAGATPAPPMVSGRRLYVGSVDNQVYALRADNGHYLWARDVGARVSRPLTWWQGRIGEGPAMDLPTEEDRLLPPVLAAEAGKIVVAVQKYDDAEAALLVFDLAPPAPEDDVAYNAPDLSEEGDPD
jgi:hypothetical protein